MMIRKRIASFDCMVTKIKQVNHIISECSKLAQKELKRKHDWVGKVILWELCKRLKLDHSDNWYMYKSEYVLENERHKILWDLRIQTDQLNEELKDERNYQPKLIINYQIVNV